MLLLNRSAVLIGLAQPYIDWAKSLDEDGEGPREDEERTLYLVPDFEGDEDAEDVLEMVYEEIFERELASWCSDDGTWPEPRTLEMFREWFSVELVAQVEDLPDEPIEVLDEAGAEFEDDGYFADDEPDDRMRHH